jgi:hypothetical protein
MRPGAIRIQNQLKPRDCLLHFSSPAGLAGPAAHETFAILRPRRRHRGRYSLGANKPAYQLDPGFLEHLRPSPRAFIGPGARCCIDAVAVSTFTKRRWWPACAL